MDYLERYIEDTADVIMTEVKENPDYDEAIKKMVEKYPERVKELIGYRVSQGFLLEIQGMPSFLSYVRNEIKSRIESDLDSKSKPDFDSLSSN